MTRVQLIDVTKQFGSTLAVDNVSADIADGEFVTLLGPSGCGKTTTLRMVAGLVDPTSGQIRFDGQLVNNVPSHKRNIGLAFQSHALFPHLSVARNIAFGLEVKGTPKAEIQHRVREMLSLIELSQHADRMPAQLSGGQQQRVALARMLATDPRVLLFDEPLSALDRNLRDTLKYSILDLQRRTGKTAIYVTHDQSEAFAISDRIFVMNEGRIEQTGTQLDIYLRPRTEFVASFVGDNNAIPGEVVGLIGAAPGESALVDIRAGGMKLRGLDPGNLRVGDKVLAFVRPENIEVMMTSGVSDEANLVRGRIAQIVFEGPTLRLIVDVDSVPIKVTVAGLERLTLLDQERRDVVLRLREVTVVRDDPAIAA
ncbi:MAG: spermidine/putrescine transporter ATP-binding protein [Thermomicrobiales bacterium]|jgi:ABC-type Fe3+/spermidine/putrescine transport system ATPase subunit|nr:spermidine/putrescine transporter ATP-binding protein [Thermomicrobiales bacterium]